MLVGCSSSTPKPEKEDRAVEHPVGRDAGLGGSDGAIPGGVGAAHIRVEWHDVPVAARASSGRTHCGTARAGAVAPTTMWGIPEVFVILDAPGGTGAIAPPHIAIDHCTVLPRAVAAGAQVEVVSHADAPLHLTLARRGEQRDPATLSAGTARSIALPVAGHSVAIALEPGGLYELTGGEVEPGWIVSAAGAFVAVTDATGETLLTDVPSGRHAVTAWLPPRAGQPGRLGKGELMVTADAVAEMTVDLAR
jgi:hypothetical protein